MSVFGLLKGTAPNSQTHRVLSGHIMETGRSDTVPSASVGCYTVGFSISGSCARTQLGACKMRKDKVGDKAKTTLEN